MSFITRKPLPFEPDALDGISLDTNVLHDDELYVGYVADPVACSMAARGWAVMAWDSSDGKIRN